MYIYMYMYMYMYIVCVRYMIMKDAEGRKKEASMYIQCISTCIYCTSGSWDPKKMHSL